MASGASTEPPPLPPPDYTPISNEEWSRKRMPPLKGVIVDPEYPPTAEEALQAIRNHDRNYEAQWQGQTLPNDIKPTPSSSSSQATTSQTQPISQRAPTDINRSSGTSNIFGRVAGDSNASTSTSQTSSSDSSTATSPATHIPQELLHKNPQDLSLSDGLTTLSRTDFLNILSQPCFRDTFMISLVSGVLAAGALWTVGKKRQWIVNGGLGTGFVMYMGVYPYCMRQRRLEKQSVKLVKETWEETRAEKRAAWEAYKAKKRREDDEGGVKGGSLATGQVSTKAGSAWNWFWSGGSTGPRGREG